MVSNGSNLHKEKQLAESNAFYQMSRLKQENVKNIIEKAKAKGRS